MPTLCVGVDVARELVLAAGGIVLRREQPPRIAVVRLRKRDQWVLPKGKLDDGETPRDAARREVLEETGHDVAVHEFLGTLAYDASGRSKIVHYWRMESIGKSRRELMDDVTAVDWLPLEAAINRLSREHERAFLANVGPLALQAAATARRSRDAHDAKTAAPVKRRRRASGSIWGSGVLGSAMPRRSSRSTKSSACASGTRARTPSRALCASRPSMPVAARSSRATALNGT